MDSEIERAAADEGASARNLRIRDSLVTVGRTVGLDVAVEYRVLGGRVDVVWLWPDASLFGLHLPLVGFEIESSWRTRKHIKGDVLNLIDLQPSLGVIVLAGNGADVEATRTFARAIAQRHATRMEIWDEERVAELAAAAALLIRRGPARA